MDEEMDTKVMDARVRVGSEEPEDENFYVMYKDRREWADVQPVPQDDGPVPIVQIEYSQKFKDVYDYFRGVMKRGEFSQRVLNLTSDAIMLNAANYTVWQYRRDVLEALGVPGLMVSGVLSEPFLKEFEFSRQMIEDNQKNYQVWHHRKILISWASGFQEDSNTISLECIDSRNTLARQELDLTECVLLRDSKNYHAWQHRQWVLSIFRTFEHEVEYVTSLILEDVRNNSAWNQRYFVLSNSSTLLKEDLEQEIAFTWSQVKLALSNESPWSYFRGVLRLFNRLDDETAFPEIQEKILDECLHLLKAGSKSCPMMSFTLDLIHDRLTERNGSSDLYNQALRICDILVEEDVLRKKYWEHIKKQYHTSFGEPLQTAS